MQVNLGMKKIIDLQNKKELIEALFYKICIQVLIIFKELSLLNQAINNYFYRPTPTPNGEWAGLKPGPGEKWSGLPTLFKNPLPYLKGRLWTFKGAGRRARIFKTII